MKLLAMMHPGTSSRGLLEDIVDGYERLGHEIVRLELGPFWAVRTTLGDQFVKVAASLEQMVTSLIERNGVDASLAMWCNGTLSLPVHQNADGSLISAMERHGQVHIHHWWDAPHWYNNEAIHNEIARGLFAGLRQIHLINNAGTGNELASVMGFRNVIPAPNAVNPRRFKPCPHVQREFDLVFLSGPGDPPPTPVMLAELEKPQPDVELIRRDLAGRIKPELDALTTRFVQDIRPLMRRLMEALVEQRLASRHGPALVHLHEVCRRQGELAPAANALVSDLRAYIAVTKTIRQIETWERPFLVAYLSRHFKCLRLGMQDYSEWGVEGPAVKMVEYDQQSEVYARASFALNVMRWQDDVGLNSKVFEITACGLGCLQAYRGGIDELFVAGREMLVFKTPGEAREMLADILNSAKRDDLAQAGRTRTLRDHTWERRLAPVMDLVGAVVRAGRSSGKPAAAIEPKKSPPQPALAVSP